jgi:hypothetical protein
MHAHFRLPDRTAVSENTALPSGQLSVARVVKTSEFAARDFGEPNWVMLTSVDMPQDDQRQSPPHIVIAVDRPRKGLTSLVECSGYDRQGLGRVDARLGLD